MNRNAGNQNNKPAPNASHPVQNNQSRPVQNNQSRPVQNNQSKPAQNQSNLALNMLREINACVVKQKIMTAKDQRNIYTINYSGKNGKQFMLATEIENPVGKRYEMNIADNNGKNLINLEVPAKTLTMNITSPPGKFIGRAVRDKTSVNTPKVDVLDVNKKLMFKVIQTVQGQDDKIKEFVVFGADGKTRFGSIGKQYGGFLQEVTTDADDFSIIFPKNGSNETKAVLLGVCMLIDLLYFDDSHEAKTTKVTNTGIKRK